MVKKLYKHEFLAWLRVIPFFWMATLFTAGVNRIVQIFDNDNLYYDILMTSSLVIYILAIFVTLATPTVFGIVRFYKNFFTGEGYLTFTLPATKRQLLWVKISTAVCLSAASALVCILSGCIVMAGEVLDEVWKAAIYLLQKIPTDGVLHLSGWGLEILVLILLGAVGSHLYYYTCICIGQTFRKNRILAAVGVHFGFYVVGQVLSTVSAVLLTILGEMGVWDPLSEFFKNNPELCIRLIFAGGILLYMLISWAYWAVCHWVIRKKLNLE